jgi:uncharacterized protein YuzE
MAGADAIYVNLTGCPIKDSEEVADGIFVDYDDAGRIVGVEILDASKRTEDPEALKSFSFDLPSVGQARVDRACSCHRGYAKQRHTLAQKFR